MVNGVKVDTVITFTVDGNARSICSVPEHVLGGASSFSRAFNI